MMMLFVVPTMAVLFAALLLLPMRRTQTVHTGVKKRVFANLGVFMVAALLLVALSSGVSAEAAPAAAEAAAFLPGRGHRDRFHRPCRNRRVFRGPQSIR